MQDGILQKSQMRNKLTLTALVFLANFVIAGFATQFGMLTEPIAKWFATDINRVASIFSLLNGGALSGAVGAYFLVDKIGIKRLTCMCYGIIVLSVVALAFNVSLQILMVAMTLIGFAGGTGLCIAGSIVVAIWQDRIQNSVLLVQDATFNVAGVFFPLITIYALTNNMIWNLSYLCVGVVALIAMVVVLFTNFSACGNRATGSGETKATDEVEWNFGVLSGGIGLFLGMLALYTFLTWAPTFVKDKFMIPFDEAVQVITHYWTAALIGALISTGVVSRISIRIFLFCIILPACIITSLIVTTDRLDMIVYLSYCYGFVCAALYNSFIAYGVSFLKRPHSKNISFILMSGSTGAMFSPFISAAMVGIIGLQAVMYVIPILYTLILILLLIAASGWHIKPAPVA